MPYIRIRSGQPTIAPGDLQGGEHPGGEDVWPQRQGRPFVLVTHKPWRPPTDIYEMPAEIVIKMELAGMHEDQLSITVYGDVLAIRGRRVDETVPQKTGYHHIGITYGEFASDIQLPGPIDQEQVRAEYAAGFLTVTLPKRRARPPGTVRIAVSE